MNSKAINLAGGGEEGAWWTLHLNIREVSKVFTGSFCIREKEAGERRRRKRIRNADSTWIAYHIPSSIWWYMEIHHDWKDGARMYLLTKKEHLIRTRNERRRQSQISEVEKWIKVNLDKYEEACDTDTRRAALDESDKPPGREKVRILRTP